MEKNKAAVIARLTVFCGFSATKDIDILAEVISKISSTKELYTFEEEFVFTVKATVANSAQEKALADKRAVAISLLLLSCKEDKKKEIQKVPFYKKILIRIFTILKKKSDICSSVIVAALAMAFPALVPVAIVLVFIIGEILTVFCDTVMDYLIE